MQPTEKPTKTADGMIHVPSAVRRRLGTLAEYLPADDIAAIVPLTGAAWEDLRRSASRSLAWRFCTLRNLLAHRGRFVNDALGFAWGGIYRPLLVSSIVTTSYRNEGHFRAGERIGGTNDFFTGGFLLPETSVAFRDIVGVVNLRHHVAGVVRLTGPDDVCVIDGYEADYAYVATAFIESIRRGLHLCGLPPESPEGRRIAGQVATILYQLAGYTGLTRGPRDLAAHDRFRDAFDRQLRARPPSPRVRRMAQEIARRIAPRTAAGANVTVREHIGRHIDPETAEFLFPGGGIDPELEKQRDDWLEWIHGKSVGDSQQRSAARQELWSRPDVAALRQAYRDAVTVNTDDEIDDRLIGAILLHEIDHAGESLRPLERRSLDLAAGQPLIRQGDRPNEMYVVLSASTPLVVLRATEPDGEPRQVAMLEVPTVLGEISMWRNQPAVATVLSPEPTRLELLVIDRERFESLKDESGFRAATAAEVQRRLALNSALVGTLLDDTAARTGDRRLASITQLLRSLTGDSHGSLDAVIDLPDDATPAECVEALRAQVDEAVRGGGLPVNLERYLRDVVATIG
jgi:CRP-like cAMP-binding protein